MKQSPLCKPHQEPVVYISFQKNHQEKIGACLKCVPNVNGPFRILEDVQKTIDQRKKQIIESTNQIKLENTNTLNKLVDNLNIYKLQQVKKIDGITEHILNILPQFESSISSIQELIANYQTFDEDNLIQYYGKIVLDGIPGINQKISQQLRQLFTEKFPEELFQIFDQVLQKSILQDILKLLETQNISENEQIWREYYFFLAQRYDELEQIFDESLNTLRSQLFTRFNKQQEKFLKSMDLFEQIKNKKRNFTRNQIQKQLSTSLNCLSEDDLKKTIKMQQKNYCYLQEQEKKKLKIFLQTQINEFNKQLDLKLLLQKNQEAINILKSLEIINTYQNFDYELLKDSTLKQQESCYAAAINHKNSILIAGFNEKITVFDFMRGKAAAKESLSHHKGKVYALQFFKQQDNFVSASNDTTLKIWSQNKHSNYQIIQTLNNHTDKVRCLALKSKTDQIISGSRDKTIRVWNAKNQMWINDQTITVHKNSVYYLSLNESENKLISSGKDDQILIMEQIEHKWELKQIIYTKGSKRLSFVTNDIFAFQPNNSQQMFIYEFQINKNQFVQTQVVQFLNENCLDQYIIPFQYIYQRQFLIHKYQNYINIIIRQDNGEFKPEKIIRFSHSTFYFVMSDNGEFLIIWDDAQNELQFRIYTVK